MTAGDDDKFYELKVRKVKSNGKNQYSVKKKV